MSAVTTVSLKKYLELRIDYEARLAAQTFAAGREALAIKDRGDRDALELARTIQTYKDEKANMLREQIGSERGIYATKDDLKAVVEKFDVALAPVLTYVASQQGRSSGLDKGWAILISAIGVAGILSSIVLTLTRHA
jgi:hypothetical protein